MAFADLVAVVVGLSWEQQVGLVALGVGLPLTVYVFCTQRALFRDELAEMQPARSYRLHDAYCRKCRVYLLTERTVCEHCDQPLYLFLDPVEMAAHMAINFPIPPKTQVTLRVPTFPYRPTTHLRRVQ